MKVGWILDGLNYEFFNSEAYNMCEELIDVLNGLTEGSAMLVSLIGPNRDAYGSGKI